MARRAVLWLGVVLMLLVCTLPALGASLTVFRLVPMIGWEKLDQVNPYATIDSDYVMELSSPMTGLRNAEASVVQVTARARVALDTSEAEISADFIPVSGEIVQVGSRLFAAPIGRQLKGTIVLTVRNPNDFPMESARVEGSVGSAFQPTLMGRSQGNVCFESNDSRGLSQADTAFIWDIGSLMPNEAVRCEISVTTRRSSAGGFGFTREGVYPVDSGFRLTYTMLGKDQTRSTTPLSIIAHDNPKALELNTGSSSAASNSFDHEWPYLERPFPERSVLVGPGPTNLLPVKPGVGGSVPIGGGQGGIAPSVSVKQSGEPAMITRAHHFVGETVDGSFMLVATGVSDNVGVEDDKFTVPTGEEAEWMVVIQVDNWASQPPSTVEWNGWTVTLLFGEHLTAEEIERVVTLPDPTVENDGELTIETDYPEPGITRVRLIWRWQQKANKKFVPGSRAYLALKVKTNGLPPSDKDLIFCDSINMEYNPVGSGYWHQVPLDPIYITCAGEPYADVSVTATRLDWRVQKPGTYAALATTVTASGIGTLSMQFSKFADLSGTGGVPGTISTFYGFGDDLAAAEAGEWISAAELNNKTRHIDLSEPVPVLMWSKIIVGDQNSSAEYENKGEITFIVSNNSIGNGGSK